jgi:hypothetical protein
LANSPQEARTLVEAAANAGWWKSSVVLGIQARNGVGDSPGLESAYYHFQIAILQGGEPAKLLLANDLDILSRQLSEEKRDELTSDASSWFSQHKATLGFVFKEREHAKRFPASALTVPPEDVHAGMLLPAPPS